MKLWIGAEIDADIADPFRLARNSVESAINSVIREKKYGLPIESWDCIAIVRSDTKLLERITFSEKKRSMDFRLRIDHSTFKEGTELLQEKMIFDMLLRSLEILKMKTADYHLPAFAELANDLSGVATERDWS